MCKAILAGPIVLEQIDQWCVAPSTYVGCAPNLGCAEVISYACMIGDPDSAHQFSSACLPELGWEFCEPPEPDPPACP
jgi:hypothetical protein